MKKTLSAILLSSVFLFSAVACKDDGEKNDSSINSVTSSSVI